MLPLLILGLVPVLALLLIVHNLVEKSLLAIDMVGLSELFSTEFRDGAFIAGPVHYGLLPALWTTFLAVVIAVAIALPASLAIAVFASEFPSGLLGRGLRGLLGMLAGIPPIVYALTAGIFTRLFMIPKFCSGFRSVGDLAALGIHPGDCPIPGLPPINPGMLPWAQGTPNSILLGGFVLALLVIPFMAPFIDDALRNVPFELKEASLSLGANRWHTLKKVTLPLALPGIISATAVGALKATGDVMIALLVIGRAAPGLPTPLWDVLEVSAPLTSIGPTLVRDTAPVTHAPVAHFAGLLLLVIAFAIMGVATLLQRRLRRRYCET
ncbi:ABC transporter permease subunit, partial [Dehalococcoidia bacterium]|nr:ABC transporter permease subunit [Dehalococcoidia bacterium]